jgi:hypothetical protein
MREIECSCRLIQELGTVDDDDLANLARGGGRQNNKGYFAVNSSNVTLVAVRRFERPDPSGLVLQEGDLVLAEKFCLIQRDFGKDLLIPAVRSSVKTMVICGERRQGEGLIVGFQRSIGWETVAVSADKTMSELV